jgi:hypothetical protein
LALKEQRRGDLTNKLRLLCKLLEARRCIPASRGNELAQDRWRLEEFG